MARSGSTKSAARQRPDLGMIHLSFASVGSIIGSGWLLAGLYAANAAGPASLISWFFGALAILFLALTHAVLGGRDATPGGSAVYPYLAFGGVAGMTSGLAWYLAAVTVAPAETLAALNYSSGWLHNDIGMPLVFNQGGALTFAGFLLATAMILLFTVINLCGVALVLRTNAVWVILKLLVPIAVIFFLVTTSFRWHNFTTNFMPYGWASVVKAMPTGIIFAYLGFEQAVQLGAKTKQTTRDLPFAVIGSVIVAWFIFFLLAVALIGSLTPTDLAGGWNHLDLQPGPYAILVQRTQIHFGNLSLAVLGLLNFGAMLSPTDTAFLYLGSSARLALAGSVAGYVPKKFADWTLNDVPWVGILIAALLGIVVLGLDFKGIAFRGGWEAIIKGDCALIAIAYGFQPLAALVLKEQYSKRPTYIPWADQGAFHVPAFLVANQLIFWSGWPVTRWAMLSMLVAGVFLSGYTLRKGRGPKNLRSQMHWKALMWIAPWLLGMTLISWWSSVTPKYPWLALITMGFSLLVCGSAVAWHKWLKLEKGGIERLRLLERIEYEGGQS